MIRHIVTFAFRDTLSREAAEAGLRAALEPLARSVPGVLALEVAVDDSGISGHWDAVLISHHASAEDLAAYQIHPDHLAAVEALDPIVGNRSVVDSSVESPL
ncbi:Dabb family protein [Leucobacter allii]|uniref:Dabb family protein n=1 Tax=Leucobacter allii TaxID=2932247 RepID=UPI001FD32707|nr:Dabb family protein [Leucobacter allii]UOR01371.1 Dabb family protein [Leucobacter allii]